MKISEFIDADIERIEEAGGYVPDEISDIADAVRAEFNTECVVEYIGGFTSPGYDLDCYAFAYFEDGGLKIHAYEHETY